MKENKSKAIKAGILGYLGLSVLVIAADVIMNLIASDPAFKPIGPSTIVFDIIIVLIGTFSIARNVYAGKKWFK